jgi:uncharacterized protein YlaI
MSTHEQSRERRAGSHEVHCSVCDGVFTVDDATYAKIERALEFDATDNPFVCDACEERFGEEEHAG